LNEVDNRPDCNCWYATNGYGENRHPSGFNCSKCDNTGKARFVMGAEEAFNEVRRLMGMNTHLEIQVRGCVYLAKLYDLVRIVGVEAAMLEIMVSLSLERELLLAKAVTNAMRACPLPQAHFDSPEAP